MSERILADLDREQLSAVTDESGRLLIVAGAGSGKTRVITRRVAWRVARGSPAHRLLAITFANKAAREMQERVAALLPEASVWVSTFHAFAARMLRIDGASIGIPREFTILDRDDQVAVVKGLLGARGIPRKETRPDAVLNLISWWKNRGEMPSTLSIASSNPVVHVAAELYEEYLAALARAHCLDFDDLLVRCLELLRHPGIGPSWKSRFDEILVDEYQDTSRVQGDILRELAARSAVVACGDPDQSIYSWRGADLSNILEFEKDFPGTRIVRLQSNYRSTAAIVATASRLIRNNQRRIERDMIAVGPPGAAPELLECRSESDEAERVARRILDLQRNLALEPTDVAVLYRTNSLSRSFERVFRAFAIPYRVVGAVEFFARKEVRDLHAFLRLKANPFDAVAFLRVVNLPPRGIGERGQRALLDAALARNLSCAELVLQPEWWPKLRGQARAGLVRLEELLRWWFEQPSDRVHALLADLVDKIRYQEYLEQQVAPAAIDRGDNVAALLKDAFEFDQRQDPRGLHGYLEERSLVQDTDEIDANGSRPGVSLMTLHSAKGLEFRAVFLVGLAADVIPHRRAVEEGGLEEERRLLYVGVTRARERLFLSYSRERFHMQWRRMELSQPSMFLGELLERTVPEAYPTSRVVEEFVDDPCSAEEYSQEIELTIGDSVRHESFGLGEVVEVRGRGAALRVRVRFDGGEKTLHLAHTRLQKV